MSENLSIPLRSTEPRINKLIYSTKNTGGETSRKGSRSPRMMWQWQARLKDGWCGRCS